MLTIHHLRASVSDRVIWLCEELGLAYEMVSYDRMSDMAAPAPYKAVSPFGTSPVITDGDLTLGESGAIVEYICMRHGGGRLTVRPDAAAYPDYLFWFHFANGSLVPGLMIDHISAAGGLPSAPSPTRTERALQLAEQRLGEAPYFAGEDFTAADVMMCLPRFADRLPLAHKPNIRAYVERVTERPAWRRTEAVR